ncbi:MULTISPECIES: DUF742 domain-containing protein [Nocardia]|uniref:DUF742 domain-containing protein n=2 Tax=Nocardia farcinica TaxID=37329 RepID=Q5Z167_NOCFA|nr:MULTISPECIES: DUF742 domain-containing protein [Nocardia]MBA4857240.1 DUF742 domain-containing protein [Nocardia farcinica]MBC9817534.1 DUF742 domain-containing protein [Nocardia farcinica]MBF6232501.1 DUF742 domain-containing protein [Nocardia farcinica]MBF6247809.1 DUF742 domain-containing protein [Nocardia elegans]MBF6361395.1 DUF742 domain-containing protein [Nocardia farcinica]
MNDRRESWFDDEAGPLVRLYAVTRGRSDARPDLNMLTLVVYSGSGTLRRTEPEYAEILRLSRTVQSIAELAAQLHLPLTTTKVLVGDLIDDGLLDFRAPEPTPDAGPRDLGTLRAVLRGIQAL